MKTIEEQIVERFNNEKWYVEREYFLWELQKLIDNLKARNKEEEIFNVK